MLYRHLPKIANATIPQLSIVLPEESETGDAILSAARDCGATLIFPGFGGERCQQAFNRLSRLSLLEDMSLIAVLDPQEGPFADQLNSSGLRARDIALVRLDAAGQSSHLDVNAFLSKAAEARREGSLLAAGVYVEGDATAVRAAVEPAGDADIWATPYSFLKADFAELIRDMGEREIPLLAFDPLAGSSLEFPPPQVHAIYSNAPTPRAKDEWALRALWENQYLASVVCPVSRVVDLLSRTAYAEAGRANSLPSRELAVLEEARRALTETGKCNTVEV
jgi:predicted aldo/keto reductase-like oxidoreductase